MPRQPIAYTVPQPLESLNIGEVRFWLDIMQEHVVLIKLGLPCDCNELINEAQNFVREFDDLSIRAEKVQSDKKFNELVRDANNAVCELHRFKRQLLRLKLTCQLAGWTFPLMLDHMVREAEYVMRLFDRMKEGYPVLKTAAKTRENVFWVRIMGDHSKFISHLLDPSERSLVATANEFSNDFDELLRQSQDFASMLRYNDNDVPAYRRFLQDVSTSTRQLRDFKRAAQDMIAQCKLVSLIPEMLAEHVRREAEHFLMILTMMEKGIMKNVAETECEASEDVFCEDISEQTINNVPHYVCEEEVEEEDDKDEDYLEDHKAKFELHESQAAEPLHMDCEDEGEQEEDDCPPPKVQPVKEAPKYKWGSKWPRPLGK